MSTWQHNYNNNNYKHVDTSPETFTCEVPNDVLQKLQADFVYDDGIIEISLLYV